MVRNRKGTNLCVSGKTRFMFQMDAAAGVLKWYLLLQVSPLIQVRWYQRANVYFLRWKKVFFNTRRPQQVCRDIFFLSADQNLNSDACFITGSISFIPAFRDVLIERIYAGWALEKNSTRKWRLKCHKAPVWCLWRVSQGPAHVDLWSRLTVEGSQTSSRL